jgi:hypothetical protein
MGFPRIILDLTVEKFIKLTPITWLANIQLIPKELAAAFMPECPHCGHYCTGNTIYCLPPIEDN